MIPLFRARDESIDPQFTGEALAAKSLELLTNEQRIKNGSLAKHKFDSKTWKKAKKQLLVESNSKCAYCESHVAVVAYGDVEHYRPKSKYWWLAYCLDNYLASCAICNQAFKSDQFPVLNRKMAEPRIRRSSSQEKLAERAASLCPDPLSASAVDAFNKLHDEEAPALVNPYIDDPAKYFAWHADMNIREVELISVSSNSVVRECLTAVKNIYGLDRPQLRRLRFFTFESYLTAKLTLVDPGISTSTRDANLTAISNMLTDEYPYAGVIRFFENYGSISDWMNDGFLTM